MTDYLLHNAFELVVIGIAFCVSKCKLIPLFLIVYVSLMTIVFGISSDCIDWLYDNGYYELYNKACARAYLIESTVILLFAAVSFVNYTRIRMLTTMTVLAQGVTSALFGALFGVSVEMNIDLSSWFDVHYSLQSIFVIIYCVIAWMCVYYSRISHK